ncbi:hypothetical protein [Amycolatopsis anabasis]|uniref:hypothetical protein n=1 Tax=Amycolatopsis anabasis TaxID=1840409 RepID=UPI00131E1266|nr:hypothetical protein [Amycolatopsis anabasis]
MLAVTVTVAGLALVAAGCSGEEKPAASAPAPAPAPSSSPAAPPPPASSGPLTRNVDFRGGQVNPPAEVVEIARGQQISLHVSSDRHDDIEVTGYPDKTEDVDPGDPEDLDFVPDRPGDIPVRLRAAGVDLLTLRVR